jgi:FlaA1/EpsC-like NDP-sugar epimerase
VRILDVAQQLARQAKRPVAIVYTGLRPGEKLHEELFGDDEKDLRPLHPLVSHVDVPPLDPVVIDHLESRDDPDALIAALASTARAETTHESEEFPGAVPSART